MNYKIIYSTEPALVNNFIIFCASQASVLVPYQRFLAYESKLDMEANWTGLGYSNRFLPDTMVGYHI